MKWCPIFLATMLAWCCNTGTGSATDERPACPKSPVVATIHVVDGMPFITAHRASFRVVIVRRGDHPSTRHEYFEMFDGSVRVGEVTYRRDGSIAVVGNLAVISGGASLAVLPAIPKDRHGEPGICRGTRMANSEPLWHETFIRV